jgi:hypothetical protein
VIMDRRSPASEERPPKRLKLDELSQRYRDGVMLAPMVRSGACGSSNPSLRHVLKSGC